MGNVSNLNTSSSNDLPLEKELVGQKAFTKKNILFASMIALGLILWDQYDKIKSHVLNSKQKIENLSPSSMTSVEKYNFEINPITHQLDMNILLHEWEWPIDERKYKVSITKKWENFEAIIDDYKSNSNNVQTLFENIKNYILESTSPLTDDELLVLGDKLSKAQNVLEDMNDGPSIASE